MANFGEFLIILIWTVLPDRSFELDKNAKIKKIKCDNLGDFQTLWNR